MCQFTLGIKQPNFGRMTTGTHLKLMQTLESFENEIYLDFRGACDEC